jgi:protein-L-isoaspartate(D-aspartate) O-methyltransferase
VRFWCPGLAGQSMASVAAFDEERRRMVEEQLARRDIRSDDVLRVMGEVLRHQFVPPEERDLAYTDQPLPIGFRQTISQPYIVALMTQLLMLTGCETVLEVGTGSGYQAAILARLAKMVYSIERLAPLAERARGILAGLDLQNVIVVDGDGSLGLPEHAPYQAILVAAAAPRVPDALKMQLADGGRLVLPVGDRGGQMLERWTRSGERMDCETIAPVAFVPLLGEGGWGDDSSRCCAPGWE